MKRYPTKSQLTVVVGSSQSCATRCWFLNAKLIPRMQVTERNYSAQMQYPTRKRYQERRLRRSEFQGVRCCKLNVSVSEDALINANNDVTEALRRTVNLMQGELERSVLSTQMLGLWRSVRLFTSNLTSTPNGRRLNRCAPFHIEHLRYA